LNKKRSVPSPNAPAARKQKLWVNLLVAFLSPLVFLALSEGVLTLVGVQPLSLTEDPYFGFASGQPLFLKKKSVDGSDIYQTNPVKLTHFNLQSFPAKKAPGTYRIFTLGGSTTYGHPWRDTTSFTAWLREMLADADPARRYEVINCGGISYASYRTAKLTEELLAYEPDLFIVYNGHNEFLEERTYRGAREGAAWTHSLSLLLDRTRTYSALRRLAGAARGGAPGGGGDKQLAGEVDDVLARTIGPTSYVRDDALRRDVLEHYYVSQKRMALLAKTVNARVVYLTTPANEKDCSPFKSEPTPGLDGAQRARVEAWMAQGRSLEGSDPAAAFAVLDSAAQADPRNAEVLYAAGQAALKAKRYPESKALLVRALDEDICPLRALPPMRETERRVARETGSGFVDFTGTLEAATLRDQGHAILGEPDFVDHVHLTVSDYGLIARGIFAEMARMGILSPGPGFGGPSDSGFVRVRERILARLTPQEEGLGYHNVAKVLNWAGKTRDAARIALRGLAKDTLSLESIPSSLFVGAQLEREGHSERALPYYRHALRLDPNNEDAIRLMGGALLRLGRDAEAAPYLGRAAEKNPDLPGAHESLAKQAYAAGRFAEAIRHLRAITARDPGNVEARMMTAGSLMNLQDPKGAEKELRALLAANPNAADGWMGLGVVAESQGDVGEAIRCYERALQLKPDMIQARKALNSLMGK
jgi:tetratricopeptide (TPR) repeat protein